MQQRHKMQEDDIKQLIHEAQTLKRQISDLRSTLNALEAQRDSYLQGKHQIQERLRNAIKAIQEFKQTRNAHTAHVKELKLQRDALNKHISHAVQELKTNKTTPDAAKKEKFLESPGFLREQIRKLEQHLETEVMSFDKEKKLMREMKLLQKKLELVKGQDEELHALHLKSRAVRDEKKEADDVHRKMQESALLSQQCHEQILQLSADIDKEREKEQQWEEQFLDLKIKFAEQSKLLNEQQERLRKVKAELEKHKVVFEEDKRQKDKALLKEKNLEVQEKLKQKKKLSTEDLLILQSMDKR